MTLDRIKFEAIMLKKNFLYWLIDNFVHRLYDTVNHKL